MVKIMTAPRPLQTVLGKLAAGQQRASASLVAKNASTRAVRRRLAIALVSSWIWTITGWSAAAGAGRQREHKCYCKYSHPLLLVRSNWAACFRSLTA